MRYVMAFLIALCACTAAQAAEYGRYDLRQLVTATGTGAETRRSFDIAYLDRILADLSSHALNYPPQFDTPQHRQRATEDAQRLSGMLDVLTQVPQPNLELLRRAALLNSMAHNLDVPGAAAKADRDFAQALKAQPGNPQIHFQYGVFLAGSGQSQRALPHLEKARQGGVQAADYSLGLLYLGMGDKTRALEHLQRYRSTMTGPTTRIDELLDAIRHGRAEVKTDGMPAKP